MKIIICQKCDEIIEYHKVEKVMRLYAVCPSDNCEESK